MIKTIKALAADIDMTLTAKGAALPEATVGAFRILHRNGVKLGLATGREISETLKQNGTNWGLGFEFDFIVGMNGGMVFDRETGRAWETAHLSTDEMRTILTFMKPLIDKYTIAVSAEGGNWNAMNINADLIASARRHGINYVDHTNDVEGFCNKPAFKLMFRTEEDTADEIRKTFLDQFGDIYQMFETYPGSVEIMRKGIDKGSGLKMYADWNQLPMENIITFGDNENDMSLLEASGWGVCLKNGNDKAKSVADDITEYECMDGGVGHYLLDHYILPNDLK